MLMMGLALRWNLPQSQSSFRTISSAIVSARMGYGERLSSALPHSVRNRLSSTGVKAGRVTYMYFSPYPVRTLLSNAA
jgi:hypothetical protein